MKTIKGDLIKLALDGAFDVIVHGCNCFCVMGAGIAVGMKNKFRCDQFPLERIQKGNVNKLGQIDYSSVRLAHEIGSVAYYGTPNMQYVKNFEQFEKVVYVVNAYTQFHYRHNFINQEDRLVDYVALGLCMRKINYQFKGKHIGLPLIGCGLAGGDWDYVQKIIKEELRDCKVTIVEYQP